MNETNPQYFLRLYLCSNLLALQSFEHLRQLGLIKTTAVLHRYKRRVLVPLLLVLHLWLPLFSLCGQFFLHKVKDLSKFPYFLQ